MVNRVLSTLAGGGRGAHPTRQELRNFCILLNKKTLKSRKLSFIHNSNRSSLAADGNVRKANSETPCALECIVAKINPEIDGQWGQAKEREARQDL